VVVTAIADATDTFVATVQLTDELHPPGFPANLCSLDRPNWRVLAELHRLVSRSDDGSLLTYRTRKESTHDDRVPDVGDRGELQQWWVAEAVAAVVSPTIRLASQQWTEADADYCLMCYEHLPKGPVWWPIRGSTGICDDCHERHVLRDELGLRQP
jgi:hypothetical protein